MKMLFVLNSMAVHALTDHRSVIHRLPADCWRRHSFTAMEAADKKWAHKCWKASAGHVVTSGSTDQAQLASYSTRRLERSVSWKELQLLYTGPWRRIQSVQGSQECPESHVITPTLHMPVTQDDCWGKHKDSADSTDFLLKVWAVGVWVRMQPLWPRLSLAIKKNLQTFRQVSVQTEQVLFWCCHCYL